MPKAKSSENKENAAAKEPTKTESYKLEEGKDDEHAQQEHRDHDGREILKRRVHAKKAGQTKEREPEKRDASKEIEKQGAAHDSGIATKLWISEPDDRGNQEQSEYSGSVGHLFILRCPCISGFLVE